MKLRHIAIIILILINIYVNYGFVKNSYEALIYYIAMTVPAGLLLFTVSYLSSKKDVGWERKLSLVGKIIAILILVIQGFITLCLLIDYYF